MSTSIRYVIARGPERIYTGHDEKPFSLEQLTTAVGLL
jgi:hypothetical protein